MVDSMAEEKVEEVDLVVLLLSCCYFVFRLGGFYVADPESNSVALSSCLWRGVAALFVLCLCCIVSLAVCGVAVSRCVVLWRCCILLLYCIALCCAELYCIALCCAELYCIALCRAVLCCCVVLWRCIMLRCIVALLYYAAVVYCLGWRCILL